VGLFQALRARLRSDRPSGTELLPSGIKPSQTGILVPFYPDNAHNFDAVQSPGGRVAASVQVSATRSRSLNNGVWRQTLSK
jgi:hypothetical protein